MVSIISPGGIRLALPDADKRPGRIFRDLGDLGSVFQTKGSDASPELLRVDSGILLTYDLAAVENRALSTDDVVEVSTVIAGASAGGATTFSFPADHIIKAVNFDVSTAATPANLDWLSLSLRPFVDPTVQLVFFSNQAAAITRTSGSTLFPDVLGLNRLPLRMHRATDYTLAARSNAGGGTTARIQMTVELLHTATGWG